MNNNMNNKLGIVCCSLALSACCFEELRPSQPVVVCVTPPVQLGYKAGTVVSKRLLPHHREEYRVRLASGEEIFFRADPPLHYKAGDEILLPP